MLWFVNSNRSIQKIVFTPFIHCYYLLSCFVISLEIKFDVFCVNSESGGVCVFRLAKIPSNAPLVFKNGWKIILMTESCWEWYKVHFYTKTLAINIMLTFSTQKIRFCMKLHKKKNCMIVYRPEMRCLQEISNFANFKFFFLQLNYANMMQARVSKELRMLSVDPPPGNSIISPLSCQTTWK